MFERIKTEIKTFPFLSGLIFLLSMMFLVASVESWKRLGTPEQTHITNNQYANKSQWQATVVLPGKGIPFQIEHFLYEPPWKDSAAHNAQVMLDELIAKCIWWISTPTWSDKVQIITCFKEKDPEYKKEK